MDRLDAPDQTGPDTVDLAAAARRLGISVDAVRKRLKRGQIQGYKSEGGRWYVHLDTPRPETDTGQDTPQSPIETELRDRIAFLEHELHDRTNEILRRDQIIAGLVQRIPQLPERTASEPEASDVGHTVEESAPPRRPWWRVWRR